MSFGMSITGDFDKLRAKLTALEKGVKNIMKDEAFGAGVQSYITRAVTRAVRKAGSVGEVPATVEVRGAIWKGWALEQNPNGSFSGTRFRERRKRQHGGWTSDAMSLDGRAFKVKRGHKMRKISRSKTNIAGFEQVWNKRMSGRKYSPTSKMMADTGHLLGFTAFVTRRVVGDGASMIITAGQQVKYFRAQHNRRNIWRWHPPEDEPKIARLLSIRAGQMIRDVGL